MLRALAALMGEARITGLLAAFQEEAGRRLEVMCDETRPAADVTAGAHGLVAMAGQLGFAELSAYCGALGTADLTSGRAAAVAELRRVAERAIGAAAAYRRAA